MKRFLLTVMVGLSSLAFFTGCASDGTAVIRAQNYEAQSRRTWLSTTAATDPVKLAEIGASSEVQKAQVGATSGLSRAQMESGRDLVRETGYWARRAQGGTGPGAWYRPSGYWVDPCGPPYYWGR